jgi:RNA polymerase sigma factor (sigma-70 family)
MLSFDEASKSDAFADECRDPEDVCAGVEAKIDLARLLSTLTREQATVTALFHLEGRDYREIATILKVPVGSVCTLLYRARRRLRKQIQRPEGNEP